MKILQNITSVLVSLLILTGCESTGEAISGISNTVQHAVQDINFDRAIPSFLQDDDDKNETEERVMAASDSQTTAVDCPSVINIDDLSALHEFINNETPRAGNAISQVQITDIRSHCTRNKNNIIIEMDIDFVANKGPQAETWDTTGNSFSYPYFMAITSSNGDIIAKEIFSLSLSYNRGQRTTTHTENLRQVMPAYGNLSATANSIIIGFQLTDSQLSYNRSLLSAASHRTAAATMVSQRPDAAYIAPAPVVTRLRAPEAPASRPYTEPTKKMAAIPAQKPMSIMAQHDMADDTFEDITAGRTKTQAKPKKAEIPPPSFDIIEPEIVIEP